MGLFGVTDIARMRTAGIDVTGVAPFLTWANTVMVPIDSPVKTLADLKGRKVAITGAGGSDASVLNEAMKSVGLKYDDVEKIYLGFPQHGPAFQNGAIDGSSHGAIDGAAQGALTPANVSHLPVPLTPELDVVRQLFRAGEFHGAEVTLGAVEVANRAALVSLARAMQARLNLDFAQASTLAAQASRQACDPSGAVAQEARAPLPMA